MKKLLGVAAALVLSAPAFAGVSEEIWVGSKIYERAFGRGCGTCHDISSNPNLLESVKNLSKDEFLNVLKHGRNSMPVALNAIMDVSNVKKANYNEAQALDAIYNYLKGRADGSVPAGSLEKE